MIAQLSWVVVTDTGLVNKRCVLGLLLHHHTLLGTEPRRRNKTVCRDEFVTDMKLWGRNRPLISTIQSQTQDVSIAINFQSTFNTHTALNVSVVCRHHNY
jgi:hypothetical protein